MFKRHKRRIAPVNQTASTQGSERSNVSAIRFTHDIAGRLKPVPGISI
jgi:hypothetical protein